MMKAILVTTAIIFASTTVATAGTVEQICWKKITKTMINKGCQFGNDLSVLSNECENRRRAAYKRCVLWAHSKQKIGPVHKVEIDKPVLRLPE